MPVLYFTHLFYCTCSCCEVRPLGYCLPVPFQSILTIWTFALMHTHFRSHKHTNAHPPHRARWVNSYTLTLFLPVSTSLTSWWTDGWIDGWMVIFLATTGDSGIFSSLFSCHLKLPLSRVNERTLVALNLAHHPAPGKQLFTYYLRVNKQKQRRRTTQRVLNNCFPFLYPSTTGHWPRLMLLWLSCNWKKSCCFN